MRIAILASGSGSNAQAIFEAIGEGRINATVTRVLSNNPQAPVLARAARFGIPSWARSHRDFPDRAAFDAAMLEELAADDVQLVVLAGYMRLLSGVFLAAFPGRIMNIHPAILPAFPGAHALADALAWGVRLTGCTVHFVEEKMDSGPVLIQAAVPVLPEDTPDALLRRVNFCEHHIYPQAVAWAAQGRIRVRGRSVDIAPFPAGASVIMAQGVPCLVSPSLEKGFGA